MINKKQQIIEEYKKTIVVHPSYREIAKKVKVHHSYVFYVVQEFKKQEQKEVVK